MGWFPPTKHICRDSVQETQVGPTRRQAAVQCSGACRSHIIRIFLPKCICPWCARVWFYHFIVWQSGFSMYLSSKGARAEIRAQQAMYTVHSRFGPRLAHGRTPYHLPSRFMPPWQQRVIRNCASFPLRYRLEKFATARGKMKHFS